MPFFGDSPPADVRYGQVLGGNSLVKLGTQLTVVCLDDGAVAVIFSVKC